MSSRAHKPCDPTSLSNSSSILRTYLTNQTEIQIRRISLDTRYADRGKHPQRRTIPEGGGVKLERSNNRRSPNLRTKREHSPKSFVRAPSPAGETSTQLVLARCPRSHLLLRLSASSSVTCPPNTTLWIASDGCAHKEKKRFFY